MEPLVSVLLLTQGRINPGRHVARANKVCAAVPNRYFLVLSMELALRKSSKAWNFEVTSGFLEDLCTPHFAHC